MKLLTIIAAVILFSSCNTNSNQAKVYEDSANYYSDMLKNATDSLALSMSDSLYNNVKTRIAIYKIMRQHYIDKMKE